MPMKIPTNKSSKDDHSETASQMTAPSVKPHKDSVIPVKVATTKRKFVGWFFNLFVRLNQFIEDKLPLWTKLFIITVPALIALSGLSIWLFVTGTAAASSSTKTNLASHLINRIAYYETQLQAERGYFIGFIDTKGKYFGDQIEDQYKITDAATNEVVPLLRQLEQEPQYLEAVEGVRFLTTLLSVQRDDFFKNYATTSSDAVLEFYNSILSRLGDLKSALMEEATNSPAVLPKAVLLFRQRDDIMKIQDLFAIRRALLVVTFTEGTWGLNASSTLNDPAYEKYMLFRDTITNEELLMQRYKTQFSVSAYQYLVDKVYTGREEMIEMQNDALREIDNSSFAYSPQHWNDLCSEVINALNLMENEMYLALQQDNSSFFTESLAQCISGALIIVFFVVPISIITLLVCRMVYKPVMLNKKLQLVAIEIAEAIGELDFSLPAVVSLRSRAKKDCNNLDLALKKIIVNFESYLPYLPRHLLVQDEDIAPSARDNASLSSCDSSKRSSRSKQSSSYRSNTKTQSSRNSSSKRRRANRVAKKNPTLMVIDLSDFVRASEEMGFDHLQTAYAEYITIISGMLEQNHGVIQSFAGGIIIISWGAANTVFEPEQKAAKMALTLLENTYANPKLSFRMRIAITTGAAVVGEMGNGEMRQFQVVSPALTRALALSKLCKHYDSSILIDQNTYKQINVEYDAKQVDIINFENTGLGSESIYQLVRSKNVKSEEWLYELKDSEEKSTFAAYNDAWAAAARGDYATARTKLEAFKRTLEGKSNDRIVMNAMKYDQLSEVIERGDEDKTFRYKCSTLMWKPENNLSLSSSSK